METTAISSIEQQLHKGEILRRPGSAFTVLSVHRILQARSGFLFPPPDSSWPRDQIWICLHLLPCVWLLPTITQLKDKQLARDKEYLMDYRLCVINILPSFLWYNSFNPQANLMRWIPLLPDLTNREIGIWERLSELFMFAQHRWAAVVQPEPRQPRSLFLTSPVTGVHVPWCPGCCPARQPPDLVSSAAD